MEELKLMEQHMSNGYKITRRDERENLLTLERPDEIKCRGRRPQHDKYRNTTTLHYGGRVKMQSKKNAQLEARMKLDGMVKPIL